MLSCLHETLWQLVVNSTANTHTHTFNGHFPGLPRWASTRKVKPIWVLLKQETVSGSGISWTVCKSAPHHSVFFTGRMPFLSPNQQHRSTEGKQISSAKSHHHCWSLVLLSACRGWLQLAHTDCSKVVRVFVSGVIYTPIPCNTRSYRNIHLGLENDN